MYPWGKKKKAEYLSHFSCQLQALEQSETPVPNPVTSRVRDAVHQQVKHLCPAESPGPSGCLLPLRRSRDARSGLRRCTQ